MYYSLSNTPRYGATKKELPQNNIQKTWEKTKKEMIRQDKVFQIKDLKQAVLALNHLKNTLQQIQEIYFATPHSTHLETEISEMMRDLEEHIGYLTVWKQNKK